MSWKSLGCNYRKSNYCDTPHGVQPIGAREAVRTFSKKRTLYKFENSEEFSGENGLRAMGEPVQYDFWCVMHLANTKTRNTDHGQRNEGEMYVFYLPDHYNHENDIHLQGSAGAGLTNYSGYPDLIEFSGDTYAVDDHFKFDVGEEGEERLICKAKLIRYLHQDLHAANPIEADGHYDQYDGSLYGR